MSDLFISYAREDQEFVSSLRAALGGHEVDAWVDWENIPFSAEWLKEIYDGIEAADCFAFILTPDSIASEVCGLELRHAIDHNKRLLPILHREVDPSAVPERLGALNWIMMTERDDLAESAEALVKTMRVDLESIHTHTQILIKAREWEQRRRDRALTLRGKNLISAEEWLASAGHSKGPAPIPLQTEYIIASRRAVTRQNRIVFGSLGIGICVAVVLFALFWVQRQRSTLYLARQHREDAIRAMEDNDVLSAQVLLATALTLDDNLQDRERFFEACVRGPSLLWSSPSMPQGKALTLSEDGNLFLISNPSGALQIWNIGLRGSLPVRYTGPVPKSAAFSANNKLLAVGGVGYVDVIDLASGSSRRLPVADSTTICVAFSNKGTLLAAGGTGKVIDLWDVKSGRLLRKLEGHTDDINSVAFSPDDALLASGSGDASIRIWKVASGTSYPPLTKHEAEVLSVAFSKDGAMLASGGNDDLVWLWDVKERKGLLPLTGGSGGVKDVRFAASRRLLSFTCGDGSVQLWDLDLGQNLLTFRSHIPSRQRNAVVSAFLRSSHDGRLVTVDELGSIHEWDLDGGGNKWNLDTLSGHERRICSVAFSHDGRLLVSGSADGSLRLWDVRSNRPLGIISSQAGRITAVAFSNDGRYLVSGDEVGAVKVWTVGGRDPTKWTLRSLPPGHDTFVWSVIFLPDGKHFLTGSEDFTVRMWDLEINAKPTVLYSLKDKVLAMSLSPGGKLLAIASGSEEQGSLVSIRNLATGKEERVLKGFAGEVWGVAFSPDGSQLVTGCDDGTATLWDMSGTGSKVMPQGTTRTGQIFATQFSPDGKTIAVACQDSAVRLWDLQGDTTTTLTGFSGPVWWSVYSEDGNFLASAGQDRLIRLWSLPEVRQIFTAPPAELLTRAVEETGLKLNGTDLVPTQ